MPILLGQLQDVEVQGLWGAIGFGSGGVFFWKSLMENMSFLETLDSVGVFFLKSLVCLLASETFLLQKVSSERRVLGV